MSLFDWLLEKLNETVTKSTETQNSTEYMNLLIKQAREMEEHISTHRGSKTVGGKKSYGKSKKKS